METEPREPRTYEIVGEGHHPGRVLKELIHVAAEGNAEEFANFFPSDHQHGVVIESSIETGEFTPIDSTHMTAFFEKVVHRAHPQLIGPIESSGSRAQAEVKMNHHRVGEMIGYFQVDVDRDGKVAKLQMTPSDEGKKKLLSSA